MKPATLCPPAALMLALGGLGVLMAAGCAPTLDVQEPPAAAQLQQRSLSELKAGLLTNDAAFRTLEADCRAVLVSPFIRRPSRLEMSGKLYLSKPGQVRLTLGGPGKTYVELVGDGQSYVVRMPALGDLAYGGRYGDPIEYAVNRIHFMPDDLADAFDFNSLLSGKSLVSRAYPPRWESVTTEAQEPPVSPAAWVIDAIVVDERQQPPVSVCSSVLIDRTTEQLRRLDKFHWDGSLRTRIWYKSFGVTRGPDGNPVRVPGELVIWYPPPLEGTIIGLALRNQKINVPIPEGTFNLEEKDRRLNTP